jgi:hypothetical protein
VRGRHRRRIASGVGRASTRRSACGTSPRAERWPRCASTAAGLTQSPSRTDGSVLLSGGEDRTVRQWGPWRAALRRASSKGRAARSPRSCWARTLGRRWWPATTAPSAPGTWAADAARRGTAGGPDTRPGRRGRAAIGVGGERRRPARGAAQRRGMAPAVRAGPPRLRGGGRAPQRDVPPAPGRRAQRAHAGRPGPRLDLAREARTVPGHERAEPRCRCGTTSPARLPRKSLHSAWEAATLEGHLDPVMAVAASADGGAAVSGRPRGRRSASGTCASRLRWRRRRPSGDGGGRGAGPGRPPRRDGELGPHAEVVGRSGRTSRSASSRVTPITSTASCSRPAVGPRSAPAPTRRCGSGTSPRAATSARSRATRPGQRLRVRAGRQVRSERELGHAPAPVGRAGAHRGRRPRGPRDERGRARPQPRRPAGGLGRTRRRRTPLGPPPAPLAARAHGTHRRDHDPGLPPRWPLPVEPGAATRP